MLISIEREISMFDQHTATKRVLSVTALLLMVVSMSASAGKELHIYNWVDYIGKDTVAHFEKETGIKVSYDITDSWETAEAKLLAGHSGYDVAFMGSTYAGRQISADVWLKLDKTKLPAWKDIDPVTLQNMGKFDPGNQYMQPWSYYGLALAYDKNKVSKIMPGKIDSWNVLLDVDKIKKISEACGVVATDSYADIFIPALLYYGYDAFSNNRKDYETILEKLLPIRPYIRTFSNTYYDMLADGDACLSNSWTGDVAYTIAKGGVKKGIDLTAIIPKEGAYIDYDGVGIIADAENVDEAYAFLNFLLKPEEAAAFTNDVKYPNSVLTSKPFIDKEFLTSGLLFMPDKELMKRLHPFPAVTNNTITRLQTRLWTKFKTNT
jgi:putrescine transport system substrate-binding protein